MGGGVSSLPDEVSLDEAKELAGAKWQPAWEEKFAEAKISRDDAVKCWQESKATISEALYEKLHGTNHSGAAEALDFSAIINEKRGQHLPGTREWVFEAVLRWRTDPDSAKLFWLVGGGGTGKSVAAAELLARLLDKQNAAAWHFCKHTEPGRSAPAVLLRSLAGMLCATVEGFEDALKESAGVKTDKVDELFEALVAKPLQSVEAPRGADDALILIIDALDELPRDALQPVLSLLATELKTLPPWIKIVATSRDEAQIKAALSGYTPSELRVDEARNRQDVRAYLTELAKEHVELEVTMESLRHEVEAKFPGLKNLDTFADLEDPLRRSKGAYDEAVRGVAGIHELEKYKERRLDLIQDETDFEKLYADAALAQTILIDALKTLPGDVADPGVKGRGSAERKLADKYTDTNGVPHPEKFRDLARATVLFENAADLLKVLTELDGGSLGLEIAQLKNKFASPTPLGYRDMNLNVSVRFDDGRKHLAEVQLNLRSVADAKHIAHEQYEVIRLALPKMCEGTSVGAGALEAFIAKRLNSSALDAAVTSLERKAGGLMLYARLIADQLEAISGKIDFASVGALPAGLDEIYAENFRRVFVDDGAWGDALPLVELVCAAAEPLTVDAASGALGWDRARCKKVCDGVSLLFPLREGDVIGVLHKTVADWLTGEPPFDKRSAEDAFFVARDAAHRRLARACARTIRAGVLDTASYSSDAAADEVLASFVEGEGGVASDAYALRWCLFHMKRSSNESEAVAVACSISYTQKRSAGDIVSFVADLNALQGQDTLLLSDSLVLSRNLLSRGLPLVEQLWQRLVPRADADSAAGRLAEDLRRVASKLPLSAVRPMGLMAAGGAERCRFEVKASCLAMFVDPATGELRVACGFDKVVHIYDPVAGGAALVVIGVRWKSERVIALAVFTDPATGAPRLALGCKNGIVRIFDPVAGGEALLFLEMGSGVFHSLAVFEDPSTGAPRLACGFYREVRVYDPVAGGEALFVIEARAEALAVFADPATGAPRLTCASGKKVVVFDPVAGGDALLVLDIGEYVKALAVFKEPATGSPRLACGSNSSKDGKVRIFDAVSGGEALVVLDAGASSLVIFEDLATGAPRLATSSGKIFDPVAGGDTLVKLDGCVGSLAAFTDPATGEPRLVSGSGDVRVWNPAAGGAAIDAEAEGHSKNVGALVTFVDPATGALRVATAGGYPDQTIRVWDADTGGALVVIDVGVPVGALAFFTDPAMGEPRLACGCYGKVHVFDPVAGGEALLVIKAGGQVKALVVFEDLATGAPRLAYGIGYEKVYVVDPVAGGEALVVIDVGSNVNALVVFTDPATGAPRLVCATCKWVSKEQCIYDVRIVDLVAGSEALVVLKGLTKEVCALSVFTDRATGGLRLASGSDDKNVRVWDLAAGGAALFVLEGGSSALSTFADPATGETRLAGRSGKTLRVWDASKSGAALRVIPFEDEVNVLTVGHDMSGLFVALGKRWGELRIESGTTPLTLPCYKDDVAAISDLLRQGAGVDQQDSDGYTPLFVASLKGHVEAARVLLDAGAAVDERREDVWSPFGIACALGHVGVARLLLEFGADTAAVNTCIGGVPPLLFACRNQNIDAMRLCLERGADPNWANEEGGTILYDACQNGRVDAARLLLDKGAEVDRANKDGVTPLIIACQNGHVDAARLLLEKGAAVDRANNDDETPLFMACRYGQVDAARLLLEKGAEFNRAVSKGSHKGATPLSIASEDGKTILYHACENGSVDAARLLLERGAEVDLATKTGATPLYAACKNGHVDAARLLLDNGAEVNRADRTGETPLYAACKNGHVDAVRLVLDKGADVNRETRWVGSPLFVACQNGHVILARLLLEKGADVNRATEDGQTPLYVACWKGHVAVATLLLDKGADVNRAMEGGCTPLYIAFCNGNVDAARMLLDKGADVNQADANGATQLYIACEKGHVNAARLLLDNGAAVDRANKNDWTPLYIASTYGRVDAVRLLLDKGADINRADKTPLHGVCDHWTCEDGHIEVVRLLLANGADVVQTTKDGQTSLDIAKSKKTAEATNRSAVIALLQEHMDLKFPLHAAARTGDVEAMTQLLDGGAELDANTTGATPLFIACENGHVDAARLLLDNGAEVNRADRRGWTPLKHTCYNGHVEVARLLLDKGAEVDRAKKGDFTPLFFACQNGHVDAARLLLERGAVFEHDSSALCKGDAVEFRYRGPREKYYPGKIRLDRGDGSYIIVYNDKGEERPVDAQLIRKLPFSPLAVAKERGHAAVIALLEEHLDSKFPLHAAARTGDVEAMTQLLDGGAEVDAKKDGAMPLLTACREGHVDVARLLLDKGAEVDRARKDGFTPLFIACQKGHVDVARLLLDKGAEVDRARKGGFTPLFFACQNGHVDAARLLLERGAVFDSSALCKGVRVEARYGGYSGYNPGKISRDCGEGKYDITYDDGAREKNVEARLIRRLPRSPLDIAQENGHAAVVALLEEHQKRQPREPRRRRRGEGSRGPGIPASGVLRASRRLRANTQGDGVRGRGRGGRSVTQPKRRPGG